MERQNDTLKKHTAALGDDIIDPFRKPAEGDDIRNGDMYLDELAFMLSSRGGDGWKSCPLDE